MSNEKKEIKNIKQLTEKTIEEGGVLSTLYFDAIGKDKEKIEQLLVELVGRLNSEKDVVYCVGDIERAIPLEGGDFSAAAKVTILTKNFPSLARICDNYGPIGVEIIKPSEIVMKQHEAQALILDHVHTISNLLKEIVERTMTPEERKKLAKILDARAERGKELLQKGEKKE
ncbi:MAG: hypothetical protein QXW80_00150 [Candidatus Micrarchaeia archaeon]